MTLQLPRPIAGDADVQQNFNEIAAKTPQIIVRTAGPITGSGTAVAAFPAWTSLANVSLTFTPSVLTHARFDWTVQLINPATAAWEFAFTRIVPTPTPTIWLKSGGQQSGLTYLHSAGVQNASFTGWDYMQLFPNVTYSVQVQASVQAAAVINWEAGSNNFLMGTFWF